MGHGADNTRDGPLTMNPGRSVLIIPHIGVISPSQLHVCGNRRKKSTIS
jgi:hypothetical protein